MTLIFSSLCLEMLARRKERYPTTYLAGIEWGLAARIFIVFQWFLLFFWGTFPQFGRKDLQICPGSPGDSPTGVLPTAECVALLWRQLPLVTCWRVPEAWGQAEEEKHLWYEHQYHKPAFWASVTPTKDSPSSRAWRLSQGLQMPDATRECTVE